MESSFRRPVEILLVEDNPGDVHLTLEALASAKIQNTVHVVEDGETAIRFLRRQGEYESAARPDLMLLDLNLPRKNGHEVLAAVREDAATRSIPVVMLTSSQREADVAKSYDLQASCYIAKPVGVEQFVEVVRGISSFWFEIVTLPGGPPQ